MELQLNMQAEAMQILMQITKPIFQNVEINRRIDHFLDPRSGNSYAEISIIDKDSEITSLIASNNLFGVQATIKQGFVSLNNADFITTFSGRVEEIKINSGTYTFIVEDYIPKLDDYLFRDIITGSVVNKISKAHYFFTTTSGIAAGSSVIVSTGAVIDPKLRSGDYMRCTSTGGGETPEFVEVEDIDATAKTITFVSIAGAHTASTTFTTKEISVSNSFATALSTSRSNYVWPPFDNTTYAHLLIDSEIIQVNTIDTSNNYIRINSRGFDLSSVASHDAGAEIREVYFLQEEPLKMVLNLLTTTAAGTNGSYDVGIANFGLGIDQSLINSTDILALNTAHFNDATWEFTMLPSTRESGLKFIVEDILRPLSIYPFIDGDGKINMGRLEKWDDVNSIASYSDADFINELPIIELKDIINQVSFSYDYNWGDGQYQTNRDWNQSDSISTYGESGVMPVNTRGMRGGTFAINAIRDFLKYLTTRYCNPYALIKLGSFFKSNILELGDIIDITHSFLIDFANGSRGVSAMDSQLRLLNSGKNNSKIEIEAFVKDYANVFNITTVTTSDIDATTNSKSAATLDANNDPATVNSQDAKYEHK